MSMEWLLRFVTWKSSVKGVLARRSEPLTATRKACFWKEVKGVIFALNLLETWRGSVGLPVAVYLAPDPPGDGSLIPWNHFLGAYLPCHPAMRSRPLLRGELRSALTARAAVASCACERWLRGMKGSGFVQLRCMEVYRGYSRYWSDSIWGSINGCLWRLWIDLPINCWVEVCTFFSCDCAADSVQWSFLKLFCLTYGLWTSRIVSLKLIRGLIIPRIQNEASWLFPDMRASASV